MAALAVLACKDSVEPLELAGPPAAAVTAGDNQRGLAGAALGGSLTVTLADSAGRPTPGVLVIWTPSAGTFSQAADTTDAGGRSTVVWTLPTVPGTYTATAAVSGLGALSFTATAQPVAGDIVFRYIDAGGYHACGITTTEQLLCWGYNADGQLGLGSTSLVTSPTLIPGDFRYRRIAGGFYHTCAYTLAANAFCWGNNSEGRLGSRHGLIHLAGAGHDCGEHDTLVGDTVVVGSTALLVQGVAAGEAHTCAIDLVQKAWCWGRNSEGQLGRGDFTSSFPPTAINTDLFKEVSVGGLHTCGITVAGGGRCWGYNVAGQLGDGSVAASNLPVAVPGTFRTDPLVIFHSPDPDFPLPPGPFVAAGYDHPARLPWRGQRCAGGSTSTVRSGMGQRPIGAHLPRSRAGTRSRRSRRASGIAARWTHLVLPGVGATTRTASLAMALTRPAPLRWPWPAGSSSPT